MSHAMVLQLCSTLPLMHNAKGCLRIAFGQRRTRTLSHAPQVFEQASLDVITTAEAHVTQTMLTRSTPWIRPRALVADRTGEAGAQDEGDQQLRQRHLPHCGLRRLYLAGCLRRWRNAGRCEAYQCITGSM
jgi:hypothetical protein